MPGIEKVARTALLMAEIRAAEAHREEKLFDDPWALLFSSQESRALLRNMTTFSSLIVTAIRMRTGYIDDVVRRALDEGVAQVVLFGAGLDSRAIRFARPGVSFIEIDDPALLSFKAQKLGARARALGVGGDYLAPGFLASLQQRGVDFTRRTLVIWEGNTFYLPSPAMRGFLRDVAHSFRDVRIVLDYCQQAVIEEKSRVPVMNAYMAALRAMSAPWICGVDDVRALAREAGLRVLEDASFEELGRRFGLALGPDAAVEYGVCVMASA